MIAGLPMYDFAWTASALDAFWELLSTRLRGAGLEAPQSLSRDRPPEDIWRDPALIFGQTCGYPYWRSLRDRVALIATPTYNFEGCEGARHCSFLIVRRGEAGQGLVGFRGARAAINARDSNTGMNLFRAAIAPLAQGRAFFSDVVVTAAHARSLAAVAEGTADIAAIDCVSFALLRRGRAELVERVEVLQRSPSSPGLPFIASAAMPPEALQTIRRSLFETLADARLAEHFAALGLTGAEVLEPQAYRRTNELEEAAFALGYPELA
jgi:ABC-type phosphate/phosphonate transport system substrate-binding protein